MPADPVLEVVDARAGGDISRVIIGGAPALSGSTVSEQCADFSARYDHLRLKLITPPHGELHMCPVLLLPPRSRDGDFGVIIMESMGYPPISGSNLFCAAAVALEYGFVPAGGPEVRLKVETPAGIVNVTAFNRDGHCRRVAFENTPSRIKYTLTAEIHPGTPPLPVTVVRAGVDYAVVDAGVLGIPLDPECHDDLARIGVRIVAAANTDFALFHDGVRVIEDGAHCTVAVFQNPSVICRSPTGTGTSALLTLAHAQGLIDPGMSLTARSPGGGVFVGRISEVREQPEGVLLRTIVSGDVELGAATTIH